MNQTTVDLVYRLSIQNSAKFFRHQYKILILPIILDIYFNTAHELFPQPNTFAILEDRSVYRKEVFCYELYRWETWSSLCIDSWQLDQVKGTNYLLWSNFILDYTSIDDCSSLIGLTFYADFSWCWLFLVLTFPVLKISFPKKCDERGLHILHFFSRSKWWYR